MSRWTADDRDAITASGRDPDEAARHLDVLTGATPATRLHRPATVGDGIQRLRDDQLADLETAHAEAAHAGRISAFVPASGAATRLCKELLAAWHGGDTAKVDRLLQLAPQLAVWPELVAHGAREGDVRSVLAAMFGDDGLGLDALPKGLIPFHRHDDGARTAFDEHLDEAIALGRDAEGRVRAHFTVGDAHTDRFADALGAARASLEAAHGVVLEVDFSVQDPATDTLAATPDGAAFRTDDGALLFRPGGHGALLRNLTRLAADGADVVLVKNIDNVVPAHRRGPLLPWRRRLAGLLVTLQRQAHDHLRALRADPGTDDVAAARAFVADVLGVQVDGADALTTLLDRPWRVCGMVKNEGQPGGGPFWADSPDGVSLQIVESAQVDTSDPDQAAILTTSTHFNPVEMALGLRDADGQPYDLSRFTDPDAVITTSKSHQGRSLLALEHPGLWNGGMARWNTVFVEVPAATFEPVKTFDDLLRAAHGGPLD